VTPTNVIATSDPRATRAGVGVLLAGGNAVDAAVCAALVLMVVEPHACGVAGDAFLLTHRGGAAAPEALDGAGALPVALTTERLAADGLDEVPIFGGRSVSVPGAMSLLFEALDRYGRLEPAEVFAPAIRTAADGYEVRPTLAAAAERMIGQLVLDDVLQPLFAPDGTPVRAGSTVVNPDLAACLDALARRGPSVLYDGPIGDAMVAAVSGDGGYLARDDLAAHRTLPMTPISTMFRDHLVWELPEPTQGRAVLGALDAMTAAGRTDDEAVAAALLAGLREVGLDLDEIKQSAPLAEARGDTTYVAAIDGGGTAASLITSVFCDFGSCRGVEALGGPLHNRASAYSFVHRPVQPGKPPHTTIPGMVTTAEGELRYALGVVGGYMQAQGQVQLLVHLLARGLDPQAAVDRPRFRLHNSREMSVEPGHPFAEAHPDALDRPPGTGGFGGAQVAGWDGTRVTGGTDARRGGEAAFL
jgi:gamma-glutamyltranspeptidase/glutathione hydrolase